MERRRFLKLTGIGAALTAISPISLLTSCGEEELMMMPGYIKVSEGSFTKSLPLPETAGANTSLVAATHEVTITEGAATSAYGYGNGILGPVIRVNTGDLLTLPFTNQLNEESNIHWHGLIVPANMDGHPENVITPGSSFTYSFSINQRAGTYWYHPHPHGNTGKQVHQGLAGMLIVNDPEENGLSLPSGNLEVPLIIQDKRLDGDQLVFNAGMYDLTHGFMGSAICVNGLQSPVLEVATRIYRFRILNGSNARIYNLALSNGGIFYVIGADSGLNATPEAVTGILLSPGERLDVLVDFSGMEIGDEIFLQSNPFTGGEGQGVESFRILKCKVAYAETETFTIPVSLAGITTLPESSATKTRTFDIGHTHGTNMSDPHSMHSLDHKIFDMDRIDEYVVGGTTEIWEFDNSAGDSAHGMHIHGVLFQVLSRLGNRNGLLASELGWKDTVLCLPGERIRVIIPFPFQPGKFVFHCHNLEHADGGMMLNFLIQ